jgi:hypothetical protein
MTETAPELTGHPETLEPQPGDIQADDDPEE